MEMDDALLFNLAGGEDTHEAQTQMNREIRREVSGTWQKYLMVSSGVHQRLPDSTPSRV